MTSGTFKRSANPHGGALAVTPVVPARRIRRPRSPGSWATDRYPIAVHDKAAGFTLIEVIGVLAIMAIAAGVLTPSIAQRISRMRAAAEDSKLAAIGDALVEFTTLHQQIPGTDSWMSEVALLLGWSPQEVRFSIPQDSSTARVFLIHPSFSPANLSPAAHSGPIWTQGTEGTSQVRDARIVILSVHRSGLVLPLASGTAPSAAEFDRVWNWHPDSSTQAPPAGWPSSWEGHGDYLHVRRINFEPLFHRVTFSNAGFPDSIPSLQIGSDSPIALRNTPTFDALYLTGTTLRVYRGNPGSDSPGMLQLIHTVRGDVNFVYAHDQWSIP